MKVVEIQSHGGPEALTIASIDTKKPGKNEVLIKNHFASVNFIDSMLRAGTLPPAMMPELPIIPGVEGAGVVEAVGNEVSDIKPGDPCMWIGMLGASGYAEYTVMDANYVVRLKPGTDLAQAAALPVNYGTALHMLRNLGRVREGTNILVRAASGGVGTALLQISKNIGCRAIAICRGDKREFTLNNGAAVALDRSLSPGEIQKEVKRLAPDGIEVSFNPVGGTAILEDIPMLGPFGHLIVFGFVTGMPEGTLEEALLGCLNTTSSITTSDLYTLYIHQPTEFRELLLELAAMLEDGLIQPKIHDAIPVDSVALAHDQLDKGLVQGKLLISF